jgi:thiamine-phosphate pyrophosphorylase
MPPGNMRENLPFRATLRRGLYLITPDELDDARLLARVRPLLPHVSCLQYRNKRAEAGQRRRQVDQLLGLCENTGTPLIVNDDAGLAAAAGADGVHLGEHDGTIAAARTLLGRDAIIGMSCYDDASLARKAAAEAADYVAFGAFFASATKPSARRASIEILRQHHAPGVPQVAIGGITPDNARTLIAAGADLIAVISGVFDAPDPVAAARAYAACFSE